MTDPTLSMPKLRPQSPTPTYIGVGIAIVGFVAIAVSWAAVAGKDNVADQMPYLIAGAGFGLGLIMVGVTIVNVAAKQRESALREQQIKLLASAIRELGDEELDDV